MIGIKLGPWIGQTPKDIVASEMARLRQPIERAILKAELFLEATVKQKLLGPRHGRIYPLPEHVKIARQQRRKGIQPRGGGGRFIPRGTYQASAPGEPPATVTGSFRSSITHSPVRWDGPSASGEVGTNDKRARIFEYGGKTGRGHRVRILPRPYMAPSFLEAQSALETILAEAVQS